jgi:hypothetical protein
MVNVPLPAMNAKTAKGKRLTGHSNVYEWERAFQLANVAGPAAVKRLKAKLKRIITPIIKKQIDDSIEKKVKSAMDGARK